MKKNTKTLLLLSSILIVLIVLYAIGAVTKPQARQKRTVSQPLIGNIKLADINGIDFKKDFVLLKIQDIWTLKREGDDLDVTDYPVNQNIVQVFLDTLIEVKRGRLVSKDPKDLSQYNLGDAAATLILNNADKKPLITLRIGKTQGSSSANYIMMDDDVAVYRINNVLSSYIRNDYLDWADLRLFPSNIALDTISQYKIQEYDHTTKHVAKTRILERGDTEWSLVGSDKNIDAVLAEKYLTDMFYLEAVDITAVDFKEETKSIVIEVTKKSGDVLKLTIYSFADSYYAKTMGGRDTLLFAVSSPSVKDKFIVDDDHFFANEPEASNTEESESVVSQEDDAQVLPTVEE